MRTKYTTAITATMAAAVLFGAPTASADKNAEPAESGVVERFETIGGHIVGPMITNMGGEALPIVIAIGWDDAVALCTGGPPVFNGVEQRVTTPSGNTSVVVHNDDAPVLVFDASPATSEPDFIAKCAAGEIVPLATGTVQQRPIVHETDRAFRLKVKSHGDVTDTSGQVWKLQALLQVGQSFGEHPVVREWVTLAAR